MTQETEALEARLVPQKYPPRDFIFQQLIFRGYVIFREGNSVSFPPVEEGGTAAVVVKGVMKFEEENLRLGEEIKALHKWVIASGVIS